MRRVFSCFVQYIETGPMVAKRSSNVDFNALNTAVNTTY
ncbi:hypothetical protein Z949_1442 [Sulfitobacter guttiformis KCTC 32187]|nr:hypothetical protein Z949_1442 [Sulfitobacter guttiformis KCTC 32187]